MRGMRRLLPLCAALLLLFACGKKEETDLWKKNAHFEAYAEGDSLGAVFYLGYAEETASAGDVLAAWELPYDAEELVSVDGGGDEWYLIVPRMAGGKVTVRAAEMDAQGALEAGELLTEDAPAVLLRCNASDILPSTVVTVTCGERSTEFSPGISLMDGSVLAGDAMLTPDTAPPEK